MASPFDNLIDEQRAAVVADGRSVAVSAGPGTGKTRVLAARAAYLIEAGVDPSQILCLTFTRSAAANIRAQVEAACGRPVDAMTFHGFAARHVLGANMRVATELESDAAIRGLYEGPMRRPRSRPISKLRQDLVWYEAMDGDDGEESRAEIDVLLYRLACAGLVPTWALIRRALRAEIPKREHVLVDEAQDATSGEQELSYTVGSNVFNVGDPKQAIMGWRGGVGFGDLDRFDGLSLTQTFRFGPAIATVANRIASAFGGAAIVPGDIEDRVQPVDPGTMRDALASSRSVAVLCRTHRDCEAAVRELDARGVPATHVQRDPLDALAHDADRIGDVVAAGRVVVSTIHAAKGREFDVVAVDPSVFDACDPVVASRAVTPEDHRVLYVAVTRARSVLMLPAEQIPTKPEDADAEGIPW